LIGEKVYQRVLINNQYAGIYNYFKTEGMKLPEKFNLFFICLGISAIMIIITSCEFNNRDQQNPGGANKLKDFPDFITSVNSYFDYRIAGIPSIDGNSYKLKISGAVDKPATFSLEELRRLEMVEKTLTIECIGNPANGNLLGTATWKGFRVYDLLESLGIRDGASTVKYISGDGYFTYNTLEELKAREVLGALYMNKDPITPKFGFPLRIIFPGYYGVRQPGWIVEMEVLKTGISDFWSPSGWKTDSSMVIDSKIFFPPDNTRFATGENIRIGGTAYGSRRISLVEITVDDGETWIPADIQRSINQDYVWVFWEVNFIAKTPGSIRIQARATSQDGRIQPQVDNESLDGTNSWPVVIITAEDGR
jgi:DMSO/TMAO reductase YedYZ molybdopterin-dependent catalytic subunit